MDGQQNIKICLVCWA